MTSSSLPRNPSPHTWDVRMESAVAQIEQNDTEQPVFCLACETYVHDLTTECPGEPS